MYSRPTLTALRNQAITDVQTGLSSTALLPVSLMRILATTEAGLAYELFSYLDWISLQSVPFTATGEYLEAWANLKGVYRNSASYASGQISFTGTTGIVVPANTLINRADGVQYNTNSDFHIGTTTSVLMTAVNAGLLGNSPVGTNLTLAAGIAGVTSSTVSNTAIVGGADQELDGSFRSRMLAVYQSPPNGGSLTDYQEWALEVSGCTRAWPLAQGMGPGSVSVFVMFDNAESVFNGFPQGTDGAATAETRYTHATGDQLLVANHLYNLRPVTALVGVFAPKSYIINFTIQGLYPTSSAIQANISAALSDLFVRQGSPLPGNQIFLSDVNAAIESVSGVVRFNLTSPATAISVPTGYLPVVGVITYI